MPTIRILALVALAAALASADEQSTASDPSKTPDRGKRALNKVFKGRIVKIRKKKVTLYYDFEDPSQLEDFEAARPPRLLDASQNKVSIEGGRLVLEGSSAIRHKMEGTGELRAKVFVRVGAQRNVGTFFTPPILNDFFVVLNLFDERFYRNGNMLLAACGLHEDEGAGDISSGLVNWRDIFSSNVKKKVKPGQDAEIEVMKDGWKEYCRVDDVEGKGSSKGKTARMESYHFGLWVHGSRATFDDLTITIRLTDEFLDLNDLKAAVETEYEEIPETGPFAGMKNVAPRLRTRVEQYVAGAGDARDVVEALLNSGLAAKIREIVAQVIMDRRDPKIVPLVIDGLYARDRETRKLSIGIVKAIVGQSFGYSPSASEKARSKAIRKLNAHLTAHRRRYYG